MPLSTIQLFTSGRASLDLCFFSCLSRLLRAIVTSFLTVNESGKASHSITCLSAVMSVTIANRSCLPVNQFIEMSSVPLKLLSKCCGRSRYAAVLRHMHQASEDISH